jgi:hypothetical protein
MRMLVVAALALGSSLLAGGCIPAGLLTFEIEAEEEVSVPGKDIAPGNALAPTETVPVDLGGALSENMEQSFSTEGVKKEAVDSLKLTGLRVDVTNPEEGGRILRDLSFFTSLKFFLGADGVDPVLVAESEDGVFNPEVIAYDFPVTEAELKGILDASDQLIMTTEAEVNDRPNFKTDLVFSVTLTAVANPAGAL